MLRPFGVIAIASMIALSSCGGGGSNANYCAVQPVKNGPIGLLGDSWTVGPGPNQPTLYRGFIDNGFRSELINSSWLGTSGQVLSYLDGIIAKGGSLSQYGALVITTGGNDMAQGIPTETIINNMISIGNDCSQLGVRCFIPTYPELSAMKNNKVTIATPSVDAPMYDIAASQCKNIEVIHGATESILAHFQDWATNYIQPSYENVNMVPGSLTENYSSDVPHPNVEGEKALAFYLQSRISNK